MNLNFSQTIVVQSDDPGAIDLLHRLARVSRRRWPETAVAMPGRLPANR